MSKFQIFFTHSACARKCALKVHQIRCFCSFSGWRFDDTVSDQKQQISGTSRRIKYEKIKKFHLAVFKKFEKEHKKQVFLHLNRCKKNKNSKIGLCTFLRLPKMNPLKKKLRKSISRLRNKSRTYGRTDGWDRNHRSRNKFRGPIKRLSLILLIS